MKTHFLKTLSLLLMLALVSPAVSATPTGPAESPAKTFGGTLPEEVDAARATVLKNRLEEIRAMDKTKLSKTEKKALRTEVKAIKQEMAAISGGVYLSVGAIVLIVLLILLLA